MIPEHIKSHNSPGLTVAVNKWQVEYLYKNIRDINSHITAGESMCWTQATSMTIPCMKKFGVEAGWDGRNQVVFPSLAFYYHVLSDRKLQPWEYQTELVFRAGISHDDGYIEKTEIHYNVAYAVVEKEKIISRYDEEVDVPSISFYDSEGNLVYRVVQEKRYDYPYGFRCRAGTYILDANMKEEKKKKEFDGGCLYCKEAKYKKENGIIYLACAKYGGQVAEVEYTGEEYPPYCKRR